MKTLSMTAALIFLTLTLTSCKSDTRVNSKQNTKEVVTTDELQKDEEGNDQPTSDGLEEEFLPASEVCGMAFAEGPNAIFTGHFDSQDFKRFLANFGLENKIESCSKFNSYESSYFQDRTGDLRSYDGSGRWINTFLPYMTNLQGLSLKGEDVVDLSYASLLSNLRNITLRNVGLSDLSPFRNLKNLSIISLIKTKITNESLNDLPDQGSFAQSTYFLDIRQNPQITDLSGLESKAQALLSLMLGENNRISDFSVISKLTKLSILDLSKTNVTSEDLARIDLSNVHNITFLDLSHTKVADIRELKKLENLRTLDLTGTEVRGLDDLSGLKNLEILYVSHEQLNDLDFSKLPEGALAKVKPKYVSKL